MRSEIAIIRKKLAAQGFKNVNIPPRTAFLQSLVGVYKKDTVRGESPVAFEISVLPKDILHAGTSRHFRSCLNYKDKTNSTYSREAPIQEQYLPNRFCAIAFVRNKKTGQFLSRVFLHHALGKDHRDVVVIEKVYGDNFPLDFMIESLFHRGVEVVYYYDLIPQWRNLVPKMSYVKLLSLKGYYVSDVPRRQLINPPE